MIPKNIDKVFFFVYNSKLMEEPMSKYTQRNKEYYEKNKDILNSKRKEAYKAKTKEEKEQLIKARKKYYLDNREQIIEKNKDWYQKNKKHVLNKSKSRRINDYYGVKFSVLKGRALRGGVPFDLDLEYLKSLPFPDTCPVLGIPLDSSTKACTPSLDRVIPSLGYVKGNVCFISTRANLLKNDASVEEVRRVLKYMESFVLS